MKKLSDLAVKMLSRYNACILFALCSGLLDLRLFKLRFSVGLKDESHFCQAMGDNAADRQEMLC
jgi:hypothetical protein